MSASAASATVTVLLKRRERRAGLKIAALTLEQAKRCETVDLHIRPPFPSMNFDYNTKNYTVFAARERIFLYATKAGAVRFQSFLGYLKTRIAPTRVFFIGTCTLR